MSTMNIYWKEYPSAPSPLSPAPAVPPEQQQQLERYCQASQRPPTSHAQGGETSPGQLRKFRILCCAKFLAVFRIHIHRIRIQQKISIRIQEGLESGSGS